MGHPRGCRVDDAVVVAADTEPHSPPPPPAPPPSLPPLARSPLALLPVPAGGACAVAAPLYCRLAPLIVSPTFHPPRSVSNWEIRDLQQMYDQYGYYPSINQVRPQRASFSGLSRISV